MALPTSGFTTEYVEYGVSCAGVPGVTVKLTLDVYDVGGESATEAVMAAIEPALISVAEALESLPGGSTGYVNKYFTGSNVVGNIR